MKKQLLGRLARLAKNSVELSAKGPICFGWSYQPKKPANLQFHKDAGKHNQ